MLFSKLSPVLVALMLTVSIPADAAGRGRAVVAAPLSSTESQDLVFMREEEKVARDVYLVLYEQWGLLPFSNIAGSEQRHMDALLQLLNKYRLADPAAGLSMGEFVNPDLQALHDSLLARGLRSDVEALKVGGAIEETDILDLRDATEHSDNTDIDTVYGKLQCGSRNHLRAFARQLGLLTGEPYQAAVMAQEDVDAIFATSHERCGR